MNCRLCNGSLELVLDLGEQCLGGQFPGPGEPDPPWYPLRLMHCAGCGLVQLDRTVPPAEMYTEYWYRSGVTKTMRNHLASLVEEAWAMRGARTWAYRVPRVLDIGCNDGTLLEYVPSPIRFGVDPNTPSSRWRIQSTYPLEWSTAPFDLIFSIAVFYDVDNPVGFAEAIKRDLSPEGLWCLEVAHLPTMLRTLAYDTICHEHLTYWSGCTLADCMDRAGLKIVRATPNQCNGGSIRCYVTHKECSVYDDYDKAGMLKTMADDWSGDCFAAVHCPKTDLAWKHTAALKAFAQSVKEADDRLTDRVCRLRAKGKTIHLLGASTKVNTILQYAGLDKLHIAFASERDPNKQGLETPGSRIPIIGERASRAMKPDAYLVGPWHFKNEILEREKGFAGEFIFPIEPEAALCS